MTATSPQRTDVDLGVCRGLRFDRGGDRWVILLPGANYPTSAPLLWFAREAALEAAIAYLGDTAGPILVGKSITSRVAPLAAREGLPAVWLTPLLNEAEAPAAKSVLDGLASASAPFLLVGGTDDPVWDGARARSFARGEVLEIRRADHALQVSGDLARSIDALRRISAAIAVFIRGLDGAD